MNEELRKKYLIDYKISFDSEFSANGLSHFDTIKFKEVWGLHSLSGSGIFMKIFLNQNPTHEDLKSLIEERTQ